MRPRLDDLDYWTEGEDWADPGLGRVLRETMSEDYADADDEAYDEALDAVLDAMSAAEAFSFQKALQQIQSGAGHALGNPLSGQVVRTALPALGTLIGGPAGTALGSQLGTLAAGALAPAGQPPKAPGGVPPTATAPGPGVAGGSAAAAQAAVLTQQQDVLKALVALAMGQHGAREVGGMPVARVMNMLSSVFGQAAADADELAYLDGDDAPDDAEEAYGEPAIGTGRSLYTALMDAENEELAS